MTRKIKFRAWDKKDNRMSDPFELHEKQLMCGEEYMADVYDLDCGDFEVMQFTGIKDKNGVEICEGDIIEVEQMQGLGKFKGIAHFGADETRPTDYRLWMDTRKFLYGIGSEWCFIHDNPEIIGNIYQHSELLSEK